MHHDHSGALAAAKRDHDEIYREAVALARRLAVVRQERRRARTILDAIMAAARKAGMTWSQIGEAMGVSAQAAAQLFARHRRRE